MTPILTFFNNKGGVGKTSLIYHLAWMYSEMGKRTVAVDLDPQANLTAAFLDENEIEQIWNDRETGTTIFNCVKPLTGVGDIAEPILKKITEKLYLLPGDVALSSFEDALSSEWPNAMNDSNLYRPMRMLSAFWQVMQTSARQINADIILVDVGPNLGAINRSALIATNFAVIPLSTDLFSLQGLKNIGPALRSWSNLWQKRLDNWRISHESAEYQEFKLPAGSMIPIGYVCQQVGMRDSRPVMAYEKWARRIPSVYRDSVLKESSHDNITPDNDPYCLSIIKHYRSLMPMAQEHNKPIFLLTPADGAIGSHFNAVKDAEKDFRALAERITEKIISNSQTLNIDF